MHRHLMPYIFNGVTFEHVFSELLIHGVRLECVLAA